MKLPRTSEKALDYPPKGLVFNRPWNTTIDKRKARVLFSVHLFTMPQDELTFKIHPALGGSEVPVSLLTQSLSMLQEMVHVFALKQEGRTVRTRLRLPEEVANKYVLVCRPPQQGSFQVSARVASFSEIPVPMEMRGAVAQNVRSFTAAAVRGTASDLYDLLPDSRLRGRALSCLTKLSPPAGSGYLIGLTNGTGDEVLLDETLPDRIEKLLLPAAERSEMQTVTGRLEQISFSERKLTMQYKPKGRWLECTYDDSVEPMLLENRRDLIQVTGRVVMDEDNHPKKIVEVESVFDLDLTPFVVTEVRTGNLRLQARNPTGLPIELSEDEQIVSVRAESWGLDAFAHTRTDLVREVKEQIAMLWQEFALEHEERLSPPARSVKARLLEDWEEVIDATR